MKKLPLLLLPPLLATCHADSPYVEPPRPIQQPQTYSFTRDVKPILDNKCVACHACNDAPCQLKLEAAAGISRGASKIAVYDASRTEAIPPTRLHIDAQTPQQWRSKGFYSVLTRTKPPQDAPLLEQMITLGHEHPVAVNQPLDERYDVALTRENSCPAPGEFSSYADANKVGGMPYGVTGLNDREYTVLKTWVQEGAQVEAPAPDISKALAEQVSTWESLLNRSDRKSRLIARYLFEHLYLAHLHFDDVKQEKPEFFQWVRSRTAAPYPIEPVPTTRPNDDPGQPFFYRLQPLTDTPVHKTHIVYTLNTKRLQRYQTLFYHADWNVTRLPGYGYDDTSNPFLTFAAIPAKARYEFMLDEAEYFTRTFIRGPVCRGQIATDVIRDQFWVMFEDPSTEQYTNSEAERIAVTQWLGLPGQNSDLLAMGSEWNEYQDARNQYQNYRTQQYQQSFPDGLDLRNVWDGNGHNSNAFLTVFRHHDSASVQRGWWGQEPKTLWLLDYPLFERIYYELVVNFNVYGNVSHQVQTRLYFDLLRNEGETQFLMLLPPGDRKTLYDNWYKDSGKIKQKVVYHPLDTESPTALPYDNKSAAKHQFIDRILQRDAAIIEHDPLNRCASAAACKDSARSDIEKNLQFLAAGTAATVPGIGWLPEVSLIRVDTADQNYRLFTVLRNRDHTNVAFMFDEEDRYEPHNDTLTVREGIVSSYPNFMFRVNERQLQTLVIAIKSMRSKEDRNAVVARWGIRRSHPQFWENFHSQTDYLQQHDALRAGVFDLNRYKGW